MWWYLAVFVVTLVLSASMQPKPQTQPPKGLGDVKAPTAEIGREIPVLFGTRDIQGPNVVWFGHFRSVAIKKKGGKK